MPSHLYSPQGNRGKGAWSWFVQVPFQDDMWCRWIKSDNVPPRCWPTTGLPGDTRNLCTFDTWSTAGFYFYLCNSGWHKCLANAYVVCTPQCCNVYTVNESLGQQNRPISRRICPWLFKEWNSWLHETFLEGFYSFSLCHSAICLRGQFITSFQWCASGPWNFAPTSRRPTTSFLVIRSQSRTRNSSEMFCRPSLQGTSKRKDSLNTGFSVRFLTCVFFFAIRWPLYSK